MNAETHDYQQFSGLPKDERKQRIVETMRGSLETHRFLLSRNPELKEHIKALSAVVKKLKKEHPEIISLNLCGSLTKGYATKESDIDAILFVDANAVDTRLHSYPFPYYDSIIRTGIKESAGLQDAQTQHCISRLIFQEKIIKTTKTGSLYDLAELFFLSIGRDINRYRKAVFDTLETMGPEGEKRWQMIMEELWYFENKNFPGKLQKERKKLYPQTIAEGRKYFLREIKSRRPIQASGAA